ncbi:MAG: hypothetical protein BWX80_00776 [Candidatus Hydrogenedentes bacterium ADurb.Bin101]|nr:MAG: hypothetical protein BWX80_00776 [Candidatus Hydrogenedentes bacterium ADurb.Bin101]
MGYDLRIGGTYRRHADNRGIGNNAGSAVGRRVCLRYGSHCAITAFNAVYLPEDITVGTTGYQRRQGAFGSDGRIELRGFYAYCKRGNHERFRTGYCARRRCYGYQAGSTARGNSKGNLRFLDKDHLRSLTVHINRIIARCQRIEMHAVEGNHRTFGSARRREIVNRGRLLGRNSRHAQYGQYTQANPTSQVNGTQGEPTAGSIPSANRSVRV